MARISISGKSPTKQFSGTVKVGCPAGISGTGLSKKLPNKTVLWDRRGRLPLPEGLRAPALGHYLEKTQNKTVLCDRRGRLLLPRGPIIIWEPMGPKRDPRGSQSRPGATLDALGSPGPVGFVPLGPVLQYHTSLRVHEPFPLWSEHLHPKLKPRVA